MKKQILKTITVTMAIMLFLCTSSQGQTLFSTVFNEEANWDNPGGGTWTGYNEKTYAEGDWFFHSTESVRGTSGESFGGSDYSFRDRDVFTIHNTGLVSGMAGFSMQLRDWMLGAGEQRNMRISLDGGDSWETIFVVNKDWFDAYQVYQEYIYYFPGGPFTFAVEEFMIELDGGGGTNNGRINIGQFVALGESSAVITPSFTPNGGTFFAPIEVTIETATTGATVFYSTISGNGPWNEYTSEVLVSETTTIYAYATADGMDDSNVAQATFTFPVVTEVATLAALREMPDDGTMYKFIGEAVIVAMDSFRNRKFIQDETAAILIDDQPGTISTQYELYDVITDVVGQLNVFNNMLRFQPVVNTEPATINTPIDPYVLALDAASTDDQAKLVKFKNVSFLNVSDEEVFANGQNYVITDGTNEFVVRTDFWNVDYIGEEIPSEEINISGVLLQFQEILQIVPRFASDFEDADADDPLFTVTFEVFDHEGAAIDDAVITFGDIVNDAGNYVFENISEGSYEYLVVSLCYASEAGLLTVNENIIEHVNMDLNILHGDANGDGIINVLDIIIIANYFAGIDTPAFCFHNSDINEDGIINILDIIATVSIFAGGF